MQPPDQAARYRCVRVCLAWLTTSTRDRTDIRMTRSDPAARAVSTSTRTRLAAHPDGHRVVSERTSQPRVRDEGPESADHDLRLRERGSSSDRRRRPASGRVMRAMSCSRWSGSAHVGDVDRVLTAPRRSIKEFPAHAPGKLGCRSRKRTSEIVLVPQTDTSRGPAADGLGRAPRLASGEPSAHASRRPAACG